jgi:short chain dehydrogenase
MTPTVETGDFAGKVAFVTASSSGIGRATALAFAREGVAVAAADLSENENQETVRMIEGLGGRALGLRCDVTSSEDVKAALKRPSKCTCRPVGASWRGRCRAYGRRGPPRAWPRRPGSPISAERSGSTAPTARTRGPLPSPASTRSPSGGPAPRAASGYGRPSCARPGRSRRRPAAPGHGIAPPRVRCWSSPPRTPRHLLRGRRRAVPGAGPRSPAHHRRLRTWHQVGLHRPAPRSLPHQQDPAAAGSEVPGRAAVQRRRLTLARGCGRRRGPRSHLTSGLPAR